MASLAIRHLAILGGGKIARLFSSLLLTGLMARILGPEGVGLWAMIIGLATLLNSGLIAWSQDVSIRFGRDEWRTGRTTIRTWSARWPFVALGFLLASILIFVNPMGWVERLFHLSSVNGMIALSAVVALWLAAEGASLFQVRNDIWALSTWAIIADVFAVLVLLLIASFGKAMEWGVVALIFASGVVWWIGCWRSWRTPFPGLPNPAADGLARTWQYASPLIPGFLVGYAAAWMGQLLLSRYAGLAEVGVYQMAYQVLVMLMGIGGMVGTIAHPRLIDRGNDVASMQEFVSRYVPTMLCLWGLLIIPIVVFTPLLLPLLLGERFEQAAGLIAILLIGVPGSVITFLYGVLFSLQGRLFRSTVVLAGTITCLGFAVSLLLVPLYGGYGAAVVLAASHLLSQGAYVYDQHRYLKSNAKQVFLATGSLLPFSVLQSVVPDKLELRLMLAFFGVLFLLFVIRRERLVDADIFYRLFRELPGTRSLAAVMGVERKQGN